MPIYDTKKLQSLDNTIGAWAEPFAGIGISAELLKQAFPENPPRSLLVLYQNCKKLKSWGGEIAGVFQYASITSAWQLQCLSGDERTIPSDILHLKQSAAPRDNLGAVPIHYLISSGLIGAAEVMRQTTSNSKELTDWCGRNPIHYATAVLSQACVSKSPLIMHC